MKMKNYQQDLINEHMKSDQEYCCYCMEPKHDKWHCCQENHFMKFSDFDDEAKTHSEHGLTNGVRWRYNSNLNTLFWVVSKTPTEKQVDAVLDYLSRKLNISNPIQKRSLTGYNYGGHYIE